MNFDSIFENWKSPYITRNQLGKVTGGLINPKTIRNLDCLGKGIKGKFTIGYRTVAYPIKEVVAWLEERANKYSNKKESNNEKRN
jgi:hypothetical protein